MVERLTGNERDEISIPKYIVQGVLLFDELGEASLGCLSNA